MDAHLVEATIKAYLNQIRNRLDKAAGIGRAADACAGAGFHEKGLSRSRHRAAPLRGNSAAECRKLDQPDRPTKLGALLRWDRPKSKRPPPSGIAIRTDVCRP